MAEKRLAIVTIAAGFANDGAAVCLPRHGDCAKMDRMPADPHSDPFRPPEIPTEVQCLHCGEEYESYLIEWREHRCADGGIEGFWCCPTPGCDGKGFGFDLLPTDPEYQDEHGGWVDFGDDGEDGFDPPDDLFSDNGDDGPGDDPVPF